MVPWDQFTAGFGALMTRLCGVPSIDPQDEGLNFSFPADAGQVTVAYQFQSETSIGRDELRTDWDPDAVIEGDTSGEEGAPVNGGVVYSANGNREIVVLIQCETHLQSNPAWTRLQAIRDKMSLPSVHDALAALGVAKQKASPIRDLSYDLDGRSVSRYVLEVTLNAMSNATDDPVTTITSVPVEIDT